MTFNGSDRKQVRAKEKEAKLEENNRIAYTRRIMSDVAGRKWMHDLLLSCQIFGEPFVRGAPDATAHNLGKQIVGKQIFADVVAHCSSEYVLMMQEATAKDLVQDIRNKASNEVIVDPDQPSEIETEYDPI